MKKLNRRDFIKLSTQTLFGLSGLLGLGGIMKYFSFHPNPAPPSEFDLGDISSYPVGSRIVRADIPAMIYNRDGKILAYSLTCTHLGCTAEWDEKTAQVVCPCHGSKYDADGRVIQGPAQKALRKLRVELLDGKSLKLYTRDGS